MVQALLAYVIALTIIASALVVDERVTTQVALLLAAFALPLTFLIYAVENTVHLLFPTKLVAMGRADFEFLGRSIVEFIAKTIFVSAAMGGIDCRWDWSTFRMMGNHVDAAWIGQLANTDVDRTSDIGRTAICFPALRGRGNHRLKETLPLAITRLLVYSVRLDKVGGRVRAVM